MENHDSRRDLSRTLGALTASAPRLTEAHRGAQNSGLFDLGALYAAELQRAIQRARPARPRPPPLRVNDLLRPLGAGSPAAASIWDIDIEDANLEVMPKAPVRALARAAGWYAVAITWLATTTLGALVATSVPAHARPAHPAPLLTVAASQAPTPAASPAPGPAALGSTPAADAPRDPKSAQAAAAPAVIAAQDLPLAPAASAASPAHATAPRRGAGQSQPHAAPPAHAVATTTDAAKSPAKAAPAPAGPVSLDEMIRRAVAADAKRKH